MKYKILKDWGIFQTGLIVAESDFGMEVDEEVISTLIADGVFEAVPEDQTSEEKIVPIAENKYSFGGKLVISFSKRENEGKTMHHIRIEDGSEYDLSDDDFSKQVKLIS